MSIPEKAIFQIGDQKNVRTDFQELGGDSCLKIFPSRVAGKSGSLQGNMRNDSFGLQPKTFQFEFIGLKFDFYEKINKKSLFFFYFIYHALNPIYV